MCTKIMITWKCNHVKMPEEIKRISNYNLKSIKIPFTIYADTESLLEKIQTCDNKPEK